MEPETIIGLILLAIVVCGFIFLQIRSRRKK